MSPPGATTATLNLVQTRLAGACFVVRDSTGQALGYFRPLTDFQDRQLGVDDLFRFGNISVPIRTEWITS
jgi:hypothetical protein